MPPTTAKHRPLHLLTSLCILGLGLYLSLLSLWQLIQTATFIRTSSTVIAVVEDVRQRPFASLSEALTHGNLAWGGSTAYQPIVAFTLTDGRRIHMALPDLNAHDYTLRSELEVRVPREDFTQTREYRNSALWGGALTDLAVGLLCTWLGCILLKIRKRTTQRRETAAPPASTPRTRPVKQKRTPPAQRQAPTEPAVGEPTATPSRRKTKSHRATGTGTQRRKTNKKPE